jgi:glutamyl-Q tRNA(Asp) synthetase
MATATTAIDKRSSNDASREPAPSPSYVGRFAPSPTGSLHLGSLVAALGSWLDARSHHGQWLVRMEDLDTPRVVPGCADSILRTLEAFGLTWDGEIAWQSRRLHYYDEATAQLRARGITFECNCSRRLRMENEERGYPGTCRDKPSIAPTAATATRFRIDENTVTIEDRFQGRCELDVRAMGDVVIRRRDGIFAYQLAVVVDDARQGITDVVRGSDLLSSTAWQICLQRGLNLITPRYGHLPLVVEPDGSKLAKSRRSVALDPTRASPQLIAALRLLRQETPPGLEFESPVSILREAVVRWNPGAFLGTRRVSAAAFV